MTVLLLLVACMLTTGSAINRRHWDEGELCPLYLSVQPRLTFFFLHFSLLPFSFLPSLFLFDSLSAFLAFLAFLATYSTAEKTHDKGANHASQTEAALQSLQKDDAIEGDQRVALSADLVFILDVSSSVTSAGCNNVGQYNARLIKFMQATVSTYGR